MACALPHTDSEVEALVQRLIDEDKGRQDDNRALICTLLKESFEKDRKLHLSMYGKAAQLEKQMETKSAWFQEKYSGCSSSQTAFPLTEKELHQLRMDEEALKEMLEEEAMNKMAQEEKIRQEQAQNDAFFLEFGVVRSSSLAVTSSGLSSNVSDAGLPSEKVMASGKNGDDGDLLLFRDSPGTWDIGAGALGICLWQLSVAKLAVSTVAVAPLSHAWVQRGRLTVSCAYEAFKCWGTKTMGTPEQAQQPLLWPRLFAAQQS
ncbi:hypothetical protein Tco_1104091 [Tanacetum coccineum]